MSNDPAGSDLEKPVTRDVSIRTSALIERFSVADRVAVVTGASSGLGVAFAVGLAEAGADIVLAARRADRLEQTAESIRAVGRRALVVPADVADPADCGHVASKAQDEFGRIDILVNNAGIASAIPAVRETPDEFSRVVEVNLSGSYWMAQACARLMPHGSSIINVSSVLAVTTAGLPQAAYSASKAALIGLTRDLAQQWTGRKGIRVNALLPGFFLTEMTQQYPDGYIDGQMKRVLIGRPGNPDELVLAVIFLASQAASYVTGQTLIVDGGFTVT